MRTECWLVSLTTEPATPTNLATLKAINPCVKFCNLRNGALSGTFHGVSPKHLQRYLDEFSYRFDRRWREGELLGFVLRRVAGGQPLPYRRLVAERAA